MEDKMTVNKTNVMEIANWLGWALSGGKTMMISVDPPYIDVNNKNHRYRLEPGDSITKEESGDLALDFKYDTNARPKFNNFIFKNDKIYF